ncbi:hypothetical protein BpHYR1_039591, partial [Brachionus plicatilis]
DKNANWLVKQIYNISIVSPKYTCIHGEQFLSTGGGFEKRVPETDTPITQKPKKNH